MGRRRVSVGSSSVTGQRKYTPAGAVVLGLASMPTEVPIGGSQINAGCGRAPLIFCTSPNFNPRAHACAGSMRSDRNESTYLEIESGEAALNRQPSTGLINRGSAASLPRGASGRVPKAFWPARDFACRARERAAGGCDGAHSSTSSCILQSAATFPTRLAISRSLPYAAPSSSRS